MQLTNFIAIFALTITGAVAVPSPNGGGLVLPVAPPPKPVKPVKPINVKPVINTQVVRLSTSQHVKMLKCS